jgi:hypothetical protein
MSEIYVPIEVPPHADREGSGWYFRKVWSSEEGGVHKSGFVRSHGISIHLASLSFYLGLSAAILSGCAEIPYPVTTGFHVPVDRNAQNGTRRYAVWSNHPAVERVIVAGLQHGGHTVIERVRLQEALTDQMNKSALTPDDEAKILAAARLLEVDRLVFAQVTIKPTAVDQTNSRKGNGSSSPFFSDSFSSDPAFHASVSVHSVAVDTGELRWSGTASYPSPITDPDKAVVFLARTAIARAKCLVMNGFEWKELNEAGGGCVLHNTESQ